MDANEKWLTSISGKYNRTKRRSFGSQYAEDKYLKPIGLSLRRNPPSKSPVLKGRLTLEEERMYFKAFHFLKYRAEKAIELKRRTVCLHRNIIWVRNHIVTLNMGLVYECLKRTRIHDNGQLLPEAHLALMRASETFNPWRGYRFSTYACNCILHSFSIAPLRRVIKITDGVDPNNSLSQNKTDEKEELCKERLQHILVTRQSGLTNVEESVLAYRFCVPINGTKPKKQLTLLEVGQIQLISKERVRQLQLSGLKKLKKALDLDPVMQ